MIQQITLGLNMNVWIVESSGTVNLGEIGYHPPSGAKNKVEAERWKDKFIVNG